MLPSDLVRWTSAAMFALFLAGFAILLLFGPRHGGSREVRASRPLGVATGPVWVALANYASVAFLLEALLPGIVYGGPLTVPFPGDSIIQVFGVLTWLAGGGLALWSGRTLGTYMRLEIEVSRDHRLVTSGPYRWVRHPTYTAVFLVSGGAAMFLLNALLAALVLVAYGIARRRALLEESLLASESGFGAEYRAYMRRTGRFLPQIRPKE